MLFGCNAFVGSWPFATDSALQRYFRNWGLSGHCADCRELCGCNLVTPAQHLRQLREVRRHAPRFVLGQCWSPSSATQQYVRNRGISGSVRLVLETTLMTDAVEKVFLGTEQIFLEALMRWSENDVGGHMISRISNRQPS